jgi:DNA-binding response OmpR family regulator
MRILVIEDEAKTAKFLQKGLGEAGSVVDVAARWQRYEPWLGPLRVPVDGGLP